MNPSPRSRRTARRRRTLPALVLALALAVPGASQTFELAAAADRWADRGEALVKAKAAGWQDAARAAARQGLAQAEAAMRERPDRVEGYFAFARNVGVYTDVVDVFTALFEGLQPRVQGALEAAYRLDKRYRHGGPMLALARYWQSLPGFAGQDLKRSLALYDELVAAFGNDPAADPAMWAWRAEVEEALGLAAAAKADRERSAQRSR